MKRYILSCLAIFSIATASELGITEKDCDRLIAEQKECVVDLWNKQRISVDTAMRICGQIQAEKLCKSKGIEMARCVSLYSSDLAYYCKDEVINASVELKKLYRGLN